MHGEDLHKLLAAAGIGQIALLDLEGLSFWKCDPSGQRVQVDHEHSPVYAMGVLQKLMRASPSNISAAELFARQEARILDMMSSENFAIAKTLLSADVGAPLRSIGATSGWDGNTSEKLEGEPASLATSGGLGLLARHLFHVTHAREDNRIFFSHSLLAIGIGGAGEDRVRLLFSGPNQEQVPVLANSVFLSIPIDRIKQLGALDSYGHYEEQSLEDMLEPETRRALGMIEMGHVAKILVEFGTPVVDPSMLPAHIAVRNSQCASVWVFPYENRQAALLFLGGEPAVQVSSLKKPHLDRWIREYVRHYLSTDIAKWSIFPWTKGRGAYSYISPDNSEDQFRPRQAMEKSQLGGKLVLGGEACSSQHPAFVMGAIDSARRYLASISSGGTVPSE